MTDIRHPSSETFGGEVLNGLLNLLSVRDARGAVRAGRVALRAPLLVLYALLLAEAFLRVCAPQPLLPRYVTGTSWGVRGNIPGADYRQTTAEVDVAIHINQQGMRADRDFPEAKPPGVCRIAMIGDSFFAGYELRLSDTIAAGVENRMRADGFQVEALNFAVSGFGTAEELRTYQAYARRFAPDYVLQEWDRSNFDDNIRSGLWRLRNGGLVDASPTYLPGVALQDWLNRSAIYRFVAANSQLYGMVREKLGLAARTLAVQGDDLMSAWRSFVGHEPTGAPMRADVSPHEALNDPRRGVSQVEIDLAGALMRKFKAEAEADNVGYLILDNPYQTSRMTFISTLQALPPDVLRSLPVLSPVAAFRAAARPDVQLFYEKGDGHYSPLAVRIILDQLVPKLEADHRFDNCRSGR
jgi:hypothetical protein